MALFYFLKKKIEKGRRGKTLTQYKCDTVDAGTAICIPEVLVSFLLHLEELYYDLCGLHK